MPPLPALVIGGGIAGLTMALALAKRGWPVVVAEKRTDASEVGAGLQLSPNASHVLIRLGLGPALGASAVAPTALAIRRWGEPRAFQRMPFTAADAPFWVTLRADLHRALREAAIAAGVTLLTGHAVERLAEKNGSVTARLGNGVAPVDIAAAFVIGADGQRSQVRRLLGDARDLDFRGYEAWRTVLPADAVEDFARTAETNLWLGPDAHAVHYPVDAGRQVNLVLIRGARQARDGWDRSGDPGDLIADKGHAADPLAKLIGQATSWSCWSLLDRAPSPFVAKGLVALAGDAAHPFLPFLAQGAAMAIEDAAVLGGLIPSAETADPASLRGALGRYAKARLPRVTRVFNEARSNGRIYHLPTPLASVRDWRIRSLGGVGMLRRQAWLYDWRDGSPPR